MEPLPKSFYFLLPVGAVATWSEAIIAVSCRPWTLQLARDMPDRVLLMPLILRHVSPEVLAGMVITLIASVGVYLGMLLACFSDRLGLKTSCKVAFAWQVASLLLVAWPRTYLLGLLLASAGTAAPVPIFNALFASQFGHQTPKLVTYFYTVWIATTMLASSAAGVLPFWMGFVGSASLSLIALAILAAASDTLKDAADMPQSPEAPPSAECDDRRIYGFGVMSFFNFLFMALFSMFKDGPFLIFAYEEVAPLGTFHVPASWAIWAKSFVGIALGILLLPWMYEHVLPLRFYVKFRIAFVSMTLACALLAAAARLAHDGVSPMVVLGAMILLGIAEIHYMPAMLAVPAEMPANKVGFYATINMMLLLPGQILAGAGVSCYKSLGAASFFMLLSGVAAAGVIGLQLLTPFFAETFDEESKGKRTPSRSIKTA